MDTSTGSESFSEFKNNFIEELWKDNPGWALYNGYYKYDDQLNVPTADFRAARVAKTKAALASLRDNFDPDELPASDATDYFIIENQLKSGIWYSEKFRSHEWNPSSYNVAGAFGLILNTDYKPMDDRLRTFSARMQNIPAYYAAAKANIKFPTLQHTDLAIQQNTGALGVFGDNLKQKVAESGLSAGEQKEFDAKRRAAIEAINDYLGWLKAKKTELQANNNARSFRIGKSLYDVKYKLDIVTEYTADEIFELALQEKDRLHNAMIEISHELWPKYFNRAKPQDNLVMVKELITEISKQHTDRDNFVQAVREQIPTLVEFVKKHDLLEQDPSKPLVVRETPEYQRGVAGASINSPGPYDPEANTYYNVTPLDHYDEAGAESYLREYNDRMLQILNIHEAIPGHYTQLVHANKSPSLIKSILGNGAMIEGWAVYTERMMLEQGYGNNEPELWLMWYKWNMRVVMNTILDYSIHTQGLTETEALDLMINQAFQEESEAKGKWRRATLSSVQLTSYFTGYKEIYDFREEMKATKGSEFNLRDFHNEFLSYGSAPVKYIKTLMRN
ncbi:MAG: DUF885 domain-containing protein [Gammaproteobacteria bacterium]|nr:DUF885 domain-containing protein [Gammaproteobacteria bacterium]